jgi:hypothetical protein
VFDYPGGKPLDAPIIDSDPDSDAEPETPEPELVI